MYALKLSSSSSHATMAGDALTPPHIVVTVYVREESGIPELVIDYCCVEGQGWGSGARWRHSYCGTLSEGCLM